MHRHHWLIQLLFFKHGLHLVLLFLLELLDVGPFHCFLFSPPSMSDGTFSTNLSSGSLISLCPFIPSFGVLVLGFAFQVLNCTWAQVLMMLYCFLGCVALH